MTTPQQQQQQQPQNASSNDNSTVEMGGVPSSRLLLQLAKRHFVSGLTGANLVITTLLFTRAAYAIISPSFFSFLLGWPASELAHLMLLLQFVNLALINHLMPSMFHSLPGQGALLVNLWSSSVFFGAARSQFAARNDFASAMLTQSNIKQTAGSSLGLRLLTFIPLFTVARRFKHVRIEKNIPYATLKDTDPHLHLRVSTAPQTVRMLNLIAFRGLHSKWNSLDLISLDPPPPSGSPVLLYVHGGGWFLGDKSFAAYAMLQRVASRGVVVFTVNYRMSPEVAFPAQIVDVKRAILWVKRNCANYNGDARKIFVSGESAGGMWRFFLSSVYQNPNSLLFLTIGHLTGLVATTPNLSIFQPPEDVNADTSVAGAIPQCGVLVFLCLPCSCS